MFGQKAAEFARQTSQMEDQAWLLVHCVGWIEIHGGDLEKGENEIREGLAIYEALDHHTGIRNALHNLGLALRYKGDFKNSRAYYEKGKQMAESMNDELVIISFKRGLSVLDISQGNLEKAKASLEEILPFVRERDQVTLPGTLANLADVNYRLKQYDAALELGKEALVLAQKMKKRPTIAWLFRILSNTETALGNYQAAFDLAKQALAFYESSKLFAKTVEELKAHIQDLQKKLAS
jgi:tetratricopeptide (TPR) repeat protein